MTTLELKLAQRSTKLIFNDLRMKPKNESDKNEFSQSLDDEKDDKFLDEIDSVIDEARVFVDF